MLADLSGKGRLQQKSSSHLKKLNLFIESLESLTNEILVNYKFSGQEDTRQWAHTFATLVAYLKSVAEMDFGDNFFHHATLVTPVAK